MDIPGVLCAGPDLRSVGPGRAPRGCRHSIYTARQPAVCRQRPYHAENTSSRPITEVKQHRARLVLGWVTAWEHRVPLSFYHIIFKG